VLKSSKIVFFIYLCTSEKSAMNNHLILKRNLCMDPSRVLSHKSINIFGSVPLFVKSCDNRKRTALFLRLCCQKIKCIFQVIFYFIIVAMHHWIKTTHFCASHIKQHKWYGTFYEILWNFTDFLILPSFRWHL